MVVILRHHAQMGTGPVYSNDNPGMKSWIWGLSSHFPATCADMMRSRHSKMEAPMHGNRDVFTLPILLDFQSIKWYPWRQQWDSDNTMGHSWFLLSDNHIWAFVQYSGPDVYTKKYPILTIFTWQTLCHDRETINLYLYLFWNNQLLYLLSFEGNLECKH